MRVLSLTLLLLGVVVAAPHLLYAASPQIAGLTLDDLGGAGLSAGVGHSLDTQRDEDCDEDLTTSDPEPFGDTLLKIKILNPLMRSLTAQRVTISIKGGQRRTVKLKRSPLLEGIIAPNSQLEIRAYLAKSRAGLKSFSNEGEPISFDGFRNVVVEVLLRDSTGKSYRVKGRGVLSIGNVDRC